jgi:hypothetical protein
MGKGVPMYGDYSPEPRLTDRVLVVEENDFDADEVIEIARAEGAVKPRDGEIFWIVFQDSPRRVWDFTERCLRQELTRKARRVDRSKVTDMADIR